MAEAFVRALVSPNPIRLETVRAYLFAIARNLYLQDLRKRRRLIRLDDNLAARSPGPEHQAETLDDLRSALGALQNLEEVDRAALLMRVEQRMSYAEIAQALEITLLAAKVKVYRARRKLAQALKE